MKKMLWPITIVLSALLASMVGCARDESSSSSKPVAQVAQQEEQVTKQEKQVPTQEKQVPTEEKQVGKSGVENTTPLAPIQKSTRAATPNPTNPPDEDFRDVTLPAGTSLGIRLNSGVSSTTSRAEDAVEATLIRPVKVGETEVLPSGSQLDGRVVAAAPSGKVKGRARLAVRFHTIRSHGETYPILAQVTRVAPATKQKDAEKIGLPAAGGAVVGGVIGGKKGAAIGAAAGGGAGTAVVLSTSGEEVSLPKGSILALKLQKAVTIRVPVKT